MDGKRTKFTKLIKIKRMRTVPYLYGRIRVGPSLLTNHCKQMEYMVPGGEIEPPWNTLDYAYFLIDLAC